jgi:hypothetical protein
MTAVGCGTVEVNPPQHSIKRREKCGLAQSKGAISRHLPTAVIALPNLGRRQRRHRFEMTSTNGRSSAAIANAIICMQTNKPA